MSTIFRNREYETRQLTIGVVNGNGGGLGILPDDNAHALAEVLVMDSRNSDQVPNGTKLLRRIRERNGKSATLFHVP
ncbi:hypothetical protein PQR46_42850, partial [Paraburkholderia sediminicola]|uniref:hypothetical protein n=1 Tax=Paraburkholderia sediminicola TaxID=458836 RepID=UPI0038B7664F